MLRDKRYDTAECARLVEQIEQHITLSDPVRDAFLSIPRLLFVPTYYQQQGRRLLWTHTHAEAQEVYTDRALVTHIDAQGMPSSSSSQPSIMAAMLEALEVKPGQRILEVGTGTGYNAALLAHLTGNPALVTTIELDAHLAEQARMRLAQLGAEQMHLYTGNGLAGVAIHAPYDRILATGGIRAIPVAWLAQLASGGILVANLLFPLSHGIVALTKRIDGSAHGRFLALTNIAFMQLREQGTLQPTQHGVNFPSYLRQPLQAEMDLSPEQVDAAALHHPTFLFYLQLEHPTLVLKYIQEHGGPLEAQETYTPYLFDEQTLTSVTLPGEQHLPQVPWTMRARGPYNLWERIYATYQRWEALHRPTLDAYQIEVNEQGQQIITLGAQRWACSSSLQASPNAST